MANERYFKTYQGWKRACLKRNPSARFDGDSDICFALGMGEWYGDYGVIYA